jgi:hypothetical protein
MTLSTANVMTGILNVLSVTSDARHLELMWRIEAELWQSKLDKLVNSLSGWTRRDSGKQGAQISRVLREMSRSEKIGNIVI